MHLLNSLDSADRVRKSIPGGIPSSLGGRGICEMLAETRGLQPSGILILIVPETPVHNVLIIEQ